MRRGVAVSGGHCREKVGRAIGAGEICIWAAATDKHAHSSSVSDSQTGKPKLALRHLDAPHLRRGLPTLISGQLERRVSPSLNELKESRTDPKPVSGGAAAAAAARPSSFISFQGQSTSVSRRRGGGDRLFKSRMLPCRLLRIRPRRHRRPTLGGGGGGGGGSSGSGWQAAVDGAAADGQRARGQR